MYIYASNVNDTDWLNVGAAVPSKNINTFESPPNAAYVPSNDIDADLNVAPLVYDMTDACVVVGIV